MLPCEIHDHAAPDFAIGDNQHAVVDSDNSGVDQIHLTYLTLHVSRRDEVTGIKGSVGENHGARSEVTERVLQGKTDDEAHYAETSNHGSDRHPDLG